MNIMANNWMIKAYVHGNAVKKRIKKAKNVLTSGINFV